jgi:hypothetical protein
MICLPLTNIPGCKRIFFLRHRTDPRPDVERGSTSRLFYPMI